MLESNQVTSLSPNIACEGGGVLKKGENLVRITLVVVKVDIVYSIFVRNCSSSKFDIFYLELISLQILFYLIKMDKSKAQPRTFVQ